MSRLKRKSPFIILRSARIPQVLFICVIAVLSAAGQSRAQETVTDQGPVPDSVLDLQSPMDLPFVPLIPPARVVVGLRERLRSTLEPYLEPLPPFFRDTQITLNPRMLYIYQDARTPGQPEKNQEAWVLGGSLAYQSGWWRDLFAIGLEGFTSQKLYAPLDHDGAQVLREGQKEFTVLGRAQGALRYDHYQITAGRQFLNLPFVNMQFGRETPNTFEAYKLDGVFEPVQFITGYVETQKRINSSSFTSMSEVAGAPPGNDRGMLLAGARFTLVEGFDFGAITEMTLDTFNTAYGEASYARPLGGGLAIKLSTQYMDQRSVGEELIGEFDTRLSTTQAALSYRNLVLRSAFSDTTRDAAIRSPYGIFPGFLASQVLNFNRAGETAWLVGFAYDCKRFINGLAVDFLYAHGADARDPATGQPLPDESETDVIVDYRIASGPLAGFWFRFRNAYIDFDRGAGSKNETRVILYHPLPIL